MRWRVASFALVAWVAGGAIEAPAQAPYQTAQRPLVTVDPSLAGPGWAVIETGAGFAHDREIPATGLTGDVLRVPELTLRAGLGGRVELRVDTGYEVLLVRERHEGPLSADLDFDGDSSSDIRDPIVSTLVRLYTETVSRPAVGLRLATRLPVASNQSGLGLDTTDFFLTLLAAKSTGPTRWIANLGLGILEVPTEVTSQHDVITYGFSLSRKVGERRAVAGGVDGHFDPHGQVRAGTEDTAVARFGGRLGVGTSTIDAAILIGLADVDAPIGFTVGLTRAFRLFDGT